MLQSEFILEALKECKANGYNTAIDTSGYSSAEEYFSIIPFTDTFLFDIKHLDPSKHLELTGVSNEKILENFQLVLEKGKEVMVRIPVIPGYNDDKEYLEKLKQFLLASKAPSLKKIFLLPYHKTGQSKYKKFNIQNRLDIVQPPSKERMQELKEFFSEVGLKVKIGG
jgi:pyruvate formate lyase activating enzyme